MKTAKKIVKESNYKILDPDYGRQRRNGPGIGEIDKEEYLALCKIVKTPAK